MTVDPAERFAVLQQSGKRLRQAITEERWRDVEEEARYAKALCTQIEHAVAGKGNKGNGAKGTTQGYQTPLVAMEEA